MALELKMLRQLQISLTATLSASHKSLLKNIVAPAEAFQRHLKPPILNSFGLQNTSAEEVVSISHLIRTTHGKGADDIDPYIAGLNIDNVALPLQRSSIARLWPGNSRMP